MPAALGHEAQPGCPPASQVVLLASVNTMRLFWGSCACGKQGRAGSSLAASCMGGRRVGLLATKCSHLQTTVGTVGQQHAAAPRRTCILQTGRCLRGTSPCGCQSPSTCRRCTTHARTGVGGRGCRVHHAACLLHPVMQQLASTPSWCGQPARPSGPAQQAAHHPQDWRRASRGLPKTGRSDAA